MNDKVRSKPHGLKKKWDEEVRQDAEGNEVTVYVLHSRRFIFGLLVFAALGVWWTWISWNYLWDGHVPIFLPFYPEKYLIVGIVAGPACVVLTFIGVWLAALNWFELWPDELRRHKPIFRTELYDLRQLVGVKSVKDGFLMGIELAFKDGRKLTVGAGKSGYGRLVEHLGKYHPKAKEAFATILEELERL